MNIDENAAGLGSYVVEPVDGFVILLFGANPAAFSSWMPTLPPTLRAYRFLSCRVFVRYHLRVLVSNKYVHPGEQRAHQQRVHLGKRSHLSKRSLELHGVQQNTSLPAGPP